MKVRREFLFFLKTLIAGVFIFFLAGGIIRLIRNAGENLFQNGWPLSSLMPAIVATILVIYPMALVVRFFGRLIRKKK